MRVKSREQPVFLFFVFYPTFCRVLKLKSSGLTAECPYLLNCLTALWSYCRWAPMASSPPRTYPGRLNTSLMIFLLTSQPSPHSWLTSTRVTAGAGSCMEDTSWAVLATCAQASRRPGPASPLPTSSWPPGSKWAPRRRTGLGLRGLER